MDLELDGKAAIVTGGSRGIGRATALGLAAEGCGVAICGHGSDDIDRALVDLRQISNHAWVQVADVTRSADVNSFVDGAAEELGGIDALVCTVGGFSGGETLEATDED